MKTPSIYQQAIYDWVKDNNNGNGAGIAVAGSGKTTTAVESMNMIPKWMNVRFNCFNKHIKEELQSRTNHLMNVEVSTYNALGWGVCRKRFGYIKLDKDKTLNTFKFGIGLNLNNPEDRKKFYRHKYNLIKMVSLCKGMGYLTVEDTMLYLDELIDHYAMDIKSLGEFKSFFYQVYEKCIASTKVMDFDDQLFMPIKHDLPIPQTDFLIVDEWQDTNNIQYTLVKRSVSNNNNNNNKGRILVIGDPDQAIYGFRGSAPEIVNTFIREHNATRLPLYICYRCSKAAVRNAQQWVPHIEPHPPNKEGCVDSIKMVDYKKMVTGNDLVLCRVTAPLITSCLNFITEGRPAYVLGREIAEGLFNLIDRILNLHNDNDNLDSTKFHELLNIYVGEQISQMEKMDKESAIQKLSDESDALNALIVGTQTVVDLKNKINNVFSDVEKTGICHMTIHKSKGLETTATGNVFSLSYKMKAPKREWMQAEERRLYYVEATRTKNDHYYVEEVK